MELTKGAPVKTAANETVGKVERVVIDPRSMKVTHLIVQKGLLLITDKVIPVEWVAAADADGARLKPDVTNFDALPDFEETHFVRMDDFDPGPGALPTEYVARPYFWYPPVGYELPIFPNVYPPVERQQIETGRNIPEGTVAVKEGAGVIDKTGAHIGSIERIITNPNTQQATHIVLSQGLLFKERILIPIHWVTRLEEDRVHLEVGAKFLDRLPPYESTRE